MKYKSLNLLLVSFFLFFNTVSCLKAMQPLALGDQAKEIGQVTNPENSFFAYAKSIKKDCANCCCGTLEFSILMGAHITIVYLLSVIYSKMIHNIQR